MTTISKYPWDGYKGEMPKGWASPERVAEFFAKLGYIKSRRTQGPKEN